MRGIVISNYCPDLYIQVVLYKWYVAAIPRNYYTSQLPNKYSIQAHQRPTTTTVVSQTKHGAWECPKLQQDRISADIHLPLCQSNKRTPSDNPKGGRERASKLLTCLRRSSWLV